MFDAMIMKVMTRTRISFLVGIALGAAIWWASPHRPITPSIDGLILNA
jgi:hypothetical protein